MKHYILAFFILVSACVIYKILDVIDHRLENQHESEEREKDRLLQFEIEKFKNEKKAN